MSQLLHNTFQSILASVSINCSNGTLHRIRNLCLKASNMSSKSRIISWTLPRSSNTNKPLGWVLNDQSIQTNMSPSSSQIIVSAHLFDEIVSSTSTLNTSSANFSHLFKNRVGNNAITRDIGNEGLGSVTEQGCVMVAGMVSFWATTLVPEIQQPEMALP